MRVALYDIWVVAAVYDRRCMKQKASGGHRPPLQSSFRCS
jgi:hypothetical protein